MKRPLKHVLAWGDVRAGYQHDSISHAFAVIERLGRESGLFDTFIRTDSQTITKRPLDFGDAQIALGESFLYRNLSYFDAIVFYGVREVPLGPDQKADLMSFIKEDGKGFVVIHAGGNAFMSWPEFGDMIGGRFDEHPWGIADASIIVEDPLFPGMEDFPSGTVINSEHYQMKGFSRDKLRVLAHLDASKLDLTAPMVHRKDGDFPVAWAKLHGKGRVYYSNLGHGEDEWDLPVVQRMYLGAIKWALRLVDADVSPQPRPATPDLAMTTKKVEVAAPRPQGDQKRRYRFAEANTDVPYRLFIPQRWDGRQKLPLVVMLHGGAADENGPFDREPAELKGVVFREAEKHGFILVSPAGYGGRYGATLQPKAADGAPASVALRPEADPSQEERERRNGLSEKDVMNVIELVAREYDVDRQRIYLMGNSMGMIGTLHLAAKYPHIWAAIAPSDGPTDPAAYPYERITGIPGIRIVHGEQDTITSIDASREIVSRMQAVGANATFARVRNGTHDTAWYIALPETFDFLEKYRRH
ncbi:MAG: ThuA domain-containing protein [Acidobacteria bacterium]|nr:ThuA domain-containing protein [Acidobacteriota bacterium]